MQREQKEAQREYRVRQAEVVTLLIALWRLRRSREAGKPLALVPMPVQGRWELLAELVRELIHEEGLVSRALAAAAGGASPEGASGVDASGLSTAYISKAASKGVPVTPKSGNNGKSKKRTKK